MNDDMRGRLNSLHSDGEIAVPKCPQEFCQELVNNLEGNQLKKNKPSAYLNLVEISGQGFSTSPA